MHRLARRAVLIPLLLVAAPTRSALGQEPDTSAIVRGVVRDPAGVGIPGVQIIVTHLGTRATFRALTDVIGAYAIHSSAATGAYTVAASRLGFKPLMSGQLKLEAGKTLAVDFVMKPAAQPLPEVTTQARGDASPALRSAGQTDNVIGAAEIAKAEPRSHDLLDLIRHLRPSYLSRSPFYGEAFVYVNGVRLPCAGPDLPRGGRVRSSTDGPHCPEDILENILATKVKEIRYLSPMEAQTLFSDTGGKPVILITTRTPGEKE